MKNAKALLPAIPIAYAFGECYLLLEGWKISSWIFFFASVLFSVIIIGANLIKEE